MLNSPGRRGPQAGVIAYRKLDDDVQVCLIRRIDGGNCGIPKGDIDPGYTPEQTALNEAWEEAGIRGRLVGARVGNYTYKKWGSAFTVAMYLMAVDQVADTWDEMTVRERRWSTLDKASVLLARHPVHALFDSVIRKQLETR